MLSAISKLFSRKKGGQSLIASGDSNFANYAESRAADTIFMEKKGGNNAEITKPPVVRSMKNAKDKLPKDFSELDVSKNFVIDGKNEFAEIYGSALVGRKQNFLMVLFSLFIAGISLVYSMRIASDKVAIPWFVEVDKSTGELSKPVQITSLAPNQAVIQSQLSKFAEKCFAIDPKLSPVYLRECAQMATGKAVEQLRVFRSEHDVIQRIRKGVDYRIAKVKSIDTTQKGVAFIHLSTHDLLPDGTRSQEKSYRIRLDYQFTPPTDQLTLIENPLGLYVSMFNPILER